MEILVTCASSHCRPFLMPVVPCSRLHAVEAPGPMPLPSWQSIRPSHLVMCLVAVPVSMRLLLGDKVVIHDVCGERNNCRAESGEHVSATSVSSSHDSPSSRCQTLVDTRSSQCCLYHPYRRDCCHLEMYDCAMTHLNIARFEKMGDLRHASRAAQGSRYNGPGIVTWDVCLCELVSC